MVGVGGRAVSVSVFAGGMGLLPCCSCVFEGGISLGRGAGVNSGLTHTLKAGLTLHDSK
jgi:hypothetical protein